MGNCLSKYPMKFEVEAFRQRKSRGSSFQSGHNAEEKARSLGFYAINKTTILTPVNDRFPAQAFDLKVEKFNGFLTSKNFRNVSAIKL